MSAEDLFIYFSFNYLFLQRWHFAQTKHVSLIVLWRALHGELYENCRRSEGINFACLAMASQ